ncbi:MAG: RHS repeat-associated core domain-containing protein, partial [Candidatus Auribacterota bacterium]
SSYRYDAFGQVIGSGMPGRGFSSKEYNERTSLSYFGARYYDASIGRFISRDPLGFVDGPNEYIYCANNPIGCVDPWGLWKRTAWNYVKDAGEQFVLGDYTDKTNALGTGLQIAAGIAGVDLIADVRDISASFVNWEWSWKHVGKTGLNIVGLLPAIGAIKNIDEAGAGIKGFAKNADEASSLAKGAVKNTDDVVKQAQKVHKNSLDYVGETHVYALKGEDGYYKIGESAQGYRVRDGASIRAEQQVRKLRKETEGNQFFSRILKVFPDKKSAREYEKKLIERFRRLFEKDSLSGNKTTR